MRFSLSNSSPMRTGIFQTLDQCLRMPPRVRRVVFSRLGNRSVHGLTFLSRLMCTDRDDMCQESGQTLINEPGRDSPAALRSIGAARHLGIH